MSVVSTVDIEKKSLLSLSETISAVSGKCICSEIGKCSFYFNSVVTDSRNVCEGSLFVPLVGEFQDGHKFVVSAIEKGASVVFVDQTSCDCLNILLSELIEEHPYVVFIVVRNTLHALQLLAARYVEKFPNLKKIAVTGSSGKTTTKEMIASVLSNKFNVVINEGNLNSETGLPLSVFKIRPEHEIGVFEMGMNRKGEIAELATVLKPSYAVITNIGTAHIGMLGSQDAIAYEKKQVFSFFDDSNVAFIPKNDKYVDFLKENLKGKIIEYGENQNVCDVKSEGLNGTSFIYKNIQIQLPLPGYGNFLDSLAAIAVAEEFGFNVSEIKNGIENIKPLFGRSQILIGKATVIQDCYNANPDSMEQALDFMKSLIVSKNRKIAVIGDMLELGSDSKKAHKNVFDKVLECNFTFVVFVGEEFYSVVEDEKSKNNKLENIFCYKHYTDESIETVKNLLNSKIKDNDVVLLKGSRGIRLERLTSYIIGEVK